MGFFSSVVTLFLKRTIYKTVQAEVSYFVHQGPVVQSPISANPGLTLNKTYGVNPGLALIGL